MKDSTKRKIKHIGVMLFLLYVLLLVYFLFFFEEYGRVAAEERVYRYNLIPFLEIRRFWIYREQLGVLAVFSNIFGNVIGFIPYGFILPVIAHKCRSGFFICTFKIKKFQHTIRNGKRRNFMYQPSG